MSSGVTATIPEMRGLFYDDEPPSRAPLSTAAEMFLSRAIPMLDQLRNLTDRDELVEVVNRLREKIHEHSPFAEEPVDFVRWVSTEDIAANDYNPNTVAPPEMQLLALSIESDGYTQPIVAWPNDAGYEVVDGFHRNRVGREVATVAARVGGYLPLTIINPDREDRGDRIAATIRHNRARGKHGIDAMSEIVVELKRRNWSDAKIGKELGMDPDEVLRLSQISGLAEMFADREFSEAWEADVINEADTLDTEEEAADGADQG